MYIRSTPPDIFQGVIKGIGALGHILDYDGSSRATGSFSGSMAKMIEDGDEAKVKVDDLSKSPRRLRKR